MSEWVENNIKKMSLKEKIGQMMISFLNDDLKSFIQLIKEYYWGGAHVNFYDLKEPVQAANLIAELQKYAKTPLFISADTEEGVGGVVAKGATEFPLNMALGATFCCENARIAGKVIGREAVAIGINLAYAPVADVSTNPDNPSVNIRSFGEEPDLVSKFVTEMARGYQESGLIACVKHFPGQGGADVDSHFQLPIIRYDLARLEKVELKPFRKAIEAGIEAVMVGHLAFPSIEPDGRILPATLSHSVITGILREKLGFNGVVITDGFAMKAITDNFPLGKAAVIAIKAGVDIILGGTTTDPVELYKSVLNAVHKGEISEDRIDCSVRRILRLKEKYLLRKKTIDVKNIKKIVGIEKHREIAKDIARSSITLVRDRKGLIPLHLDDSENVLVIDPVWSKAIKIGVHLRHKTIGEIVRLRHKNTTQLFMDQEPTDIQIKEAIALASRAKIIIVGIFSSLVSGLTGTSLSKKLVDFIQRLEENNKSLIVISTGSPYFIRELPRAGTYLNTYGGSQASIEAVVEVIFGEVKPSGRLPVTISQQYPYGFSGCNKKEICKTTE